MSLINRSDNAINENRNSVWIFFIIPAFFAFFQFLFACYHYPLLGDDSIAFLPASINFQQGNGLVNGTYWITRFLNQGQPEVAYVNYPPLYPLVNGYLLFLTDNLHLNAAIVHSISMCLFTALLCKINNEFVGLSKWKFTILLFLLLAAWNTQLSPGDGRPEPLAQLWISILLYNLIFNKRSNSRIISGFMVGVIGFTHPVAGIYCLFICLVELFCRGSNLIKIFRYAVGGLISLALIILLYPFAITRMLKGISEHGKLVADRSLHTMSSFFYYHFTSPYVSFYFLIFLLGLAGILLLLVKNRNFIQSRVLFFPTLIVFFIIVLYFTFQTMEASYNLYVLFPVLAIGVLYISSIVKSKISFLFILGCVCLGSIGFGRRLILFNAHIQHGLSFNEAKSALSKIPLDSSKIFVTASFYTLPPNISNVTDDIKDSTVQYILYQQNFTGLEKPKEFPGFNLVDDKFSNQVIKVAGIKIANGAPGYQYALYEKIGKR